MQSRKLGRNAAAHEVRAQLCVSQGGVPTGVFQAVPGDSPWVADHVMRYAVAVLVDADQRVSMVGNQVRGASAGGEGDRVIARQRVGENVVEIAIGIRRR